MTKVKALAIAAIVTVAFLSLGLGISAHSNHKDTGDPAVRSVAQVDAVSVPADQTGALQSVSDARSAKHDGDDDHDRDGVNRTRGTDRGHDDEDEDD